IGRRKAALEFNNFSFDAMVPEDAKIARNVNRRVNHIGRSHRNAELYFAHFFARLLRLRGCGLDLQSEDAEDERSYGCQDRRSLNCSEALLSHLASRFSFPV